MTDVRLRSMIDQVLIWIGDARDRSQVIPVVMKGGPAHESRSLVFLFSIGDRAPFAVLKVAYDDQEREFVRREYASLRVIAEVASPLFMELVPKPLGLLEYTGASCLATSTVDGRRILVPSLGQRRGYLSKILLTRFLERTYAWSRELAGVEPGRHWESSEFSDRVATFVELFDPSSQVKADLQAFAGVVSRSNVTWETCWQHGDLSVGNVLYHHNSLAVLDWENAMDGRPPWYDAINSLILLASLAQRQTNSASLGGATSLILDRSYWVGKTVSDVLLSSWDYSLPLSWAAPIGLIESSISRYQMQRTQWPEWGGLLALVFGKPASPLHWLRPD